MDATEQQRIFEQLNAQRNRLERAAVAAGRRADEVTLIAVSKRQDASAIAAAYLAGQRDFGENYVQELLHKAQRLSHLDDIRWHLIGHLQSNKAKYVTGVVHTVHAVDSSKLAAELSRRWEQRRELGGDDQGDPLPVLIEVNVSGEPSKSGCSPQEVEALCDAVSLLPGLQLSGLMTMPPATEDPEGARPYFEQLVELRARLGGPARLRELSIGMSHDAEVAIACGATMVRIGTAIFGPRPD